MSASILGESVPPRRLPSTGERQSRTDAEDDNRRIATIVASLRGRAKLGLQASSRLSKLIRRLNFGRSVIVVDEELIDVEVVSEAVVVASHMIKVKIELVDDRGDPVLKEEII